MFFLKYKKLISLILILLVIIPYGILLKPQKAEAISSGSVVENIEIFNIKEFLLDTVAKIAVNMLLSAITNSIVNWINSGFEGNPTFVQNPGDFLADAADQATGVFIQELGMTELCSADWLPKLKLSLQYNVPYTQRMQCTLTGVAENFEDNLKRFEDSFMNGGWDSWLSMTAYPQNNIWGAYFESSDELARRKAAAMTSASMEASWGQGFNPLKKCVGASQETYCDNTCAHLEGTDDFDDCFNGCQDIEGVDFSSSDYCEQSGGQMQNTTPGKVIGDTISHTLGAGQETLIAADELSESIAAVLNALINQLITSGLNSLTSSDGGSGDWYDAPPSSDEITTATETIDYYLDFEYQYRDIKQASVNAYDTTINKLKLLIECYQKQNPPNQTRITEIEAEINNYETKKDPLEAEVANSQGLINEAEVIKTDILNAGTSTELGALLNKFTNEIQPEMHLYDIQSAQTEYDLIKNGLDAKNSEIDAEYNQCLSGV